MFACIVLVFSLHVQVGINTLISLEQKKIPFLHFSILAHLKHPHVVSLQESFFDSSEELLFIVQVRN